MIETEMKEQLSTFQQLAMTMLTDTIEDCTELECEEEYMEFIELLDKVCQIDEIVDRCITGWIVEVW